jgi:hypothetical protein
MLKAFVAAVGAFGLGLIYNQEKPSTGLLQPGYNNGCRSSRLVSEIQRQGAESTHNILTK